MALTEAMETFERLQAAALALPAEQRIALARALAESVVDEPISPAWMAEIRRRIEAMDRGEMEMFDNEEVFAEMRARLG